MPCACCPALRQPRPRLLVSLPFRWSKVFTRSPSSEVLVSKNLTRACQSSIRRLCKISSCCELFLRMQRSPHLSSRHTSAAPLFSRITLFAASTALARACADGARMQRHGGPLHVCSAAARDGPWIDDPRRGLSSRGPPRLSVPGLPRGLRISARVQTFAAADPASDNGRDCCSGLTAAEATL